MQSWLRWVARHPAATLLGVVLASLAALAGIVEPRTGRVRLEVDPALDEMLPADDAERRFYESLRERFGSDDTLVVTLHGDDLFTPAGLARVASLSDRLESLPGVRGVESLATALRLYTVEGDLEIAPFLEELPATRDEARALRAEVLADSLRAGSLVSADARTTALLVTFDEMREAEFLARELDLRVAEAASEEAGPFEVWIAGTPRVKAEIGRILTAELTGMVPVVLVLMLALSYAFFRSWWFSLVPVLTVVTALLWTLGVVAWAGHALNIVTTLVPPLVLVLGFAYAIHVVSAFRSEEGASAADPGERARARQRALGRVGFPVVFTALTTAAGFLSITVNDLQAIRDFGLYSAVGVSASLAAALLATPALLGIGGHGAARRPQARSSRLDGALARLAAFDLTHRRTLMGAGAAVLTIALVLTARIEVNTEVIGNFRADAPVRRSYEAINEHLDGANTFYVMLESPQAGAFEEPSNLRVLADLQRWLTAQEGIGGATSMVDYLRVIHDGFLEGDGTQRRLPDSAELTAQLLLFGSNDELEKLVDPSRRTATIVLRSTSTASKDFADLATRIDARLAELPPHLSGRATGNAVLLTRAADRISRGQALSLIAAFGMIGLVLMAYFRSIALGALALLPNALPVAVYFGMLGLTGVTLNNATALMGSIVLGIAVDDTIHFLVHWRSLVRRTGDRAHASAEALREVGRPVTYTTVVLCLGLLVVATSDLKTQAQFGALGAFTLAVAWAADVLLMPALCSLLPVGKTARAT
ncbi:MAG: MMPL family transporter [Myxococcota bacterium]|nr:MMPL family transporter [Myxococcota bacterium]